VPLRAGKAEETRDLDERPRSGPPVLRGRGRRFPLILMAVALTLVILIQYLQLQQRPANVDYSEFKSLVQAGLVQEITIDAQTISGSIRAGDLRAALPAGRVTALQWNADAVRRFTTVRIEDPQLLEQLDAAGTAYRARRGTQWVGTLLSWIIPVALLYLLWTLILRRMGSAGGGLLEIGKSRAKVYVERETGVTFADVAGVDEAKAELQEVVEFLKSPAEHGRLGARIPKGILLVGPPGTGKTLLARAVAGEAGVAFFSISGSEFVELFVGVGASRVRDLFQQARARAPAIIFIDELDAVGRARGFGPLGGGHDEKEQTLNQLLAELDGFDPSVGVVLLAATNRPEILDPALLRAGRFDRQVLVDRPDRIGRVRILQVHARKIRLAPEVDLDNVAGLTPGFTGADLANLVNEAALVATRRRAPTVTSADFTAALERIVAGLEKRNRLLNPDERRTVAFHETGHALLALCLPGSDIVHKVSIIPRGIGALGYTLQRPTEDRYLMSSGELLDKMTVLLGGRAAEHVAFGSLSTGAADDLAKATDIARSMVMRFGMHPSLGLASYEAERPAFLQAEFQPAMPRRYSEDTARDIDCAVRGLLDDAFKRAVQIITTHRSELERAASALLERETLTGEELRALLVPVPGDRLPRSDISTGAPRRVDAGLDTRIDAELDQTFPASDPLPWTHRTD
jgi:cell division protease FtsH